MSKRKKSTGKRGDVETLFNRSLNDLMEKVRKSADSLTPEKIEKIRKRKPLSDRQLKARLLELKKSFDELDKPIKKTR